MSTFHDVRLPLSLAFGAGGGPEMRTDVALLASGRETRNARWATARRRWDVGGVLLDGHGALDLRTFFEARRGRWAGFRFRDPLDGSSSAPGAAPDAGDQLLGIGDGARVTFQLVKAYQSGGVSWSRVITRPAEGSVVVGVDGAPVAGASVNHQTGVVTLAEAPASGALVTAGFQFDVPVRFEVDRLELTVEAVDAFRLGPTPLFEIFDGGGT